MSFLVLTKIKIYFADRELTQKTYTLDEALLTTKQIQIIDLKKLTTAVLIIEKKVFLIKIAYLESKTLIYLVYKAQIALRLAKKITIFKKYSDFSDIFFKKSVAILPDYLNINKYQIDPELNKQLFYRLIYSLNQVELEAFKTFIEANLANEFI